jgi:hypothetical protein
MPALISTPVKRKSSLSKAADNCKIRYVKSLPIVEALCEEYNL